VAVYKSLRSLIRSADLRAESLASAHEFLARPPIELPSCLVLYVKLQGLSRLDLQQELAKAAVRIRCATSVDIACRCASRGALIGSSACRSFPLRGRVRHAPSALR